jgi:threonine aldolase
MRQAGIIAAGGVYALDHNIERLVEDHANAKLLAEALASMTGVDIRPEDVETNIVFFELTTEASVTAPVFVDRLEQRGVRMIAMGPSRIRAVTHLDVSREGIERALETIRDVLRG